MPDMLRHRLTFGPIMIAVLIGVLWADQAMQNSANWPGGTVILILLLLPAMRLATGELAAMLRAKGATPNVTVMFLAAAVGCLGLFGLNQSDHEIGQRLITLACAGAGAFVVALVVHAWPKRTDGALLAGASATLAFVYLGLMPGFLLAIRAEHSAWVLAAVILVTKSCDIGAYFTGMSIGRHKLIAWLSPGKTWEGLVGGMVVAALAGAFLLRPLLSIEISLPYALLTGALLGLAGQAGDLIASMLKRDAQVKDSGSALPGFGGVIDVIDSPLLAGPVAYWLLAIAG